MSALRKALRVGPKERVTFSLPSQSVFTRFVKLPGSSPEEVDSIIGFEAQQNVPFPIDEVVWDYQIMGEAKEQSRDVVLVAIKADQLDEINAAVNKGGLRTLTIDVAPMALSNAFRYNYSELTGCSLLIDIGARTTNLIFIENKRVFSRSIPVGGSTISAAIAKELKQDITLGERLKIEKGLVGLGGNYAEPDDPGEAKISKIIRNTMTRLHAEIARSISFYRQNQSGGPPVRAFLCGGTVTLPYMIEFFNEKLQIPIEHFNSLRNVTVASEQMAAQVAGRAHMLGEVVGCALRFVGNTPIEINVRPHSVVREQDLSRRKPLLVLAAICALSVPTGWWLYFSHAGSPSPSMLARRPGGIQSLRKTPSTYSATTTLRGLILRPRTSLRRPSGIRARKCLPPSCRDGVTFLSRQWSNGKSFRSPFGINGTRTVTAAGETTVRTALLMGDNLSFLNVPANRNQGGGDSCLSGGVHNFLRFIESWGTRVNYCGSLINLFNSRNNNGAHKNGGGHTYGPPTRNWVFDSSFLDPDRLPPGTPFFQFVQMTGFRQTVRQVD